MSTSLDFKELQQKIGYRFKDRALLENAMMHPSYVNEHGYDKTMSNQRLEYLGDAVVELSVTSAIFEKLPDADEGAMSSLRAKLVCTSGLAGVARGMHLGRYLILGRGADMGNERENPTVLEDAFEALVGAIFLDGGWRKASTFVCRSMEAHIRNAIEGIGGPGKPSDRKSALQMELQKQGPAKITYRLRGEEGPPHERTFYVDVFLRSRLLGSGVGYSKKEAEQDAAGYALEAMNVLEED
ncbi:MAG: ribonuclease III [Clostridiales Family XIII bacterium]|jgi:ribonuclease-3|nr:ribonuclease III [Clostridiales Family XIII bacterium]